MNLRYCLMRSPRKIGHPQKVMRELGITYQHATPQSMFDMWQFWNCENIPDELPAHITEFKRDPMDMIGYGLSESDAKKIANYKSCDK